MKRFYTSITALVTVSFLLFITGCKHDDVSIGTGGTSSVITAVNDGVQVTATISGIVLDENNVPIAAATVTSGTSTTTTDVNGMFNLNNISLSKNNGSVTVKKTGYFEGVRSFRTISGKDNRVKIQLMQKTLSGTVNGTAGGSIGSTTFGMINFPAGAFVTAAGAAYTGTVNVYSRYIDPTAYNLPFIIPGDQRGISASGAEGTLETYGMIGAELQDVSGNVLKIAPGKNATITVPIPSSLSAHAPSSIPLWHFDDVSSRWKEEGAGTKSGNTYTAQVNKFSFWNFDVPDYDLVTLDFNMMNGATNTPFVSATTRIVRLIDGIAYCEAYTNTGGTVSGLAPKNETLIMQMVSDCGNVLYSQNIGPFTANTNLGNINISLPSAQYRTFSGTLMNCSGVPVSNGYITLFTVGGRYAALVNTNSSGTFSFSLLNCTGSSATYNYQGTDNATTQQSPLLSGSVVSGAVNLSNISVCGSYGGTGVYVAGEAGYEGPAAFWKDGLTYVLSASPNPSSASSIFVSGTDVYACGYEENSNSVIVAKIWKNGVPTNLTTGISGAYLHSIFVSGNDVYVVGEDYFNINAYGDVAKIWKNGVGTFLASNISEANGVFVSGSDVYVAGQDFVGNSGSNTQVAKVWKNGVGTNLTTGMGNFADAMSVFVDGTDVYVVGMEITSPNSSIQVAKMWKNGVVTILGDGVNSSVANSVFISGSDVYVAGTRYNGSYYVATLWKNGVPQNLADGTHSSSARSVFVKGTDVYVAGEYNLQATLWKNAVAVTLPGTSPTTAYSVFVK